MTADMHEKLNIQQRKVIEINRPQILVVSGPGTGKTTVIVHYLAQIIQKGLASPQEILAVTFTKKAAGEMEERILAMVGKKPVVSTIHSFAAGVLRKFPPPGYPKDFTIIDEGKQFALTAELLNKEGIDFHPQYVLEQLALARNLREKTILRRENLLQFYNKYMEKLRNSNCIDYDGLLTWCLYVFNKHPQALAFYQQRFKYILVDEFQDISALQYQLILNLVQQKGNFLFVGDFDQSIYGWRGADINIMLDLEKNFPKLTTLYLEENYRSTASIIAMANRLIKNNTHRKDKPLWTKRPAGKEPVIKEYYDEYQEAADIIAKIKKESAQGKPLAHFAILYRVHVLSRPLEELLSQEQIPYQVIGGTGYFQHREIQDIIAFYRLILNPHDEEAFITIANMLFKLNKSKNRLSKNQFNSHGLTLLESTQFAQEKYIRNIPNLILAISKQTSLEKIYDKILTETQYLDYLAQDKSKRGEKRVENIEDLRSVLLTFDQKGKKISEFLEFIHNTRAGNDENSVKLLTIHAAKGLEFDTVFIVGTAQGQLPYYKYENAEGLEEERRLLYVALTRAKNNLQISYPLRKLAGGKRINLQPSQFITELKEKDKGRKKPSFTGCKLTTADISEGSIIIHSHFGKGYIVAIASQGGLTCLTIDFTDHGRKDIILEYANLQLA